MKTIVWELSPNKYYIDMEKKTIIVKGYNNYKLEKEFDFRTCLNGLHGTARSLGIPTPKEVEDYLYSSYECIYG